MSMVKQVYALKKNAYAAVEMQIGTYRQALLSGDTETIRQSLMIIKNTLQTIAVSMVQIGLQEWAETSAKCERDSAVVHALGQIAWKPGELSELCSKLEKLCPDATVTRKLIAFTALAEPAQHGFIILTGEGDHTK